MATQRGQQHDRLQRLVEAAGVMTQGGREVTCIRREGAGFSVAGGGAAIAARQVLVAANLYSGPLSPWRRRVIAIGNDMLANEPLPSEGAAALSPLGRMVVENRRVVICFRLSLDRRQVICGGRAALAVSDPLRSLPQLYRVMLEVFPQLAGTAVGQARNGFAAFTLDELPRIAVQHGVFFWTGYCRSGELVSPCLGMRAGQRILGRAAGNTPLNDLTLQTHPLHLGSPWFPRPSVAWYRVADRLFT